MKTNITKIGAALLAVGICIWATELRAQTTTTDDRHHDEGRFYRICSRLRNGCRENRSEPGPLRYVVTKQTTIVDEAGAPVAIERISPGSPLSVEYTGTGDQSRRLTDRCAKAGVVTAPVTTAPVVTEQHTTTTTTTTRPLTHDEKKALKEQKEDRKEREGRDRKAQRGLGKGQG